VDPEDLCGQSDKAMRDSRCGDALVASYAIGNDPATTARRNGGRRAHCILPARDVDAIADPSLG